MGIPMSHYLVSHPKFVFHFSFFLSFFGFTFSLKGVPSNLFSLKLVIMCILTRKTTFTVNQRKNRMNQPAKLLPILYIALPLRNTYEIIVFLMTNHLVQDNVFIP